MSRYDDPRWYEEQDTNPQHLIQPTYTNGVHPSYGMTGAGEDDAIQNSYFPPPSAREKRFQRVIKQVVGSIVLVVIAFVAGWFSHQFFGNAFFAQSNQSQQYEQLIQQAWTTVDQNYVDRKAVDYKQMSYGAIQSIVNSLHDTGHSRFLTPADVQAQNQSLGGTFTGIGIYLRQDKTTNQLIITSPIPASPAEKAGIKSGDIILAVNGTNIAGKSIDTVSNLIHGPTGTNVSVTIQRPSTKQTLTFKMVRAEIKVPSVLMHYIPQDHIAHIQIVQFADGVSAQLKDALTKAKKLGATKIILDLRNNPGGFVNEAVDTASEFMKTGNVYLQQDSSGQRTPIAVTGNTVDTTDTLVVLINGNSASASEIVSGSLQDNKRATLIGEKTFGTGTVLQQFPLSDGSAILLGVQEWLTPSGHFIRTTKINPTIQVVQNPNVPIVTPTDENDNNLTEQQILSSGDAQLVRAITYLDTQK